MDQQMYVKMLRTMADAIERGQMSGTDVVIEVVYGTKPVWSDGGYEQRRPTGLNKVDVLFKARGFVSEDDVSEWQRPRMLAPPQKALPHDG